MKKSLRIALTLIALQVAFSCVHLVQSQGRPPIAGGYKEVAPDDAGVVAAADFAVADHAQKKDLTIKLIGIQHAQQQVVAGINYKLCLKVEVSEKDSEATVKDVQVVVYRNLQNVHSLTSWEDVECSESD
ncbi:MAG: hypothetical protein QOC96_2275 [Acidobacteriota bacterium]|nr:hypothetical protein [Acidobacteriota bacterium]